MTENHQEETDKRPEIEKREETGDNGKNAIVKEGDLVVKEGDIVEGVVKKITPFGAFVRLGNGQKGLVHISQIDNKFVEEVSQHLKVGETVKAKVVAILDGGKIDLSIKKAKPQSYAPRRKGPKRHGEAPRKTLSSGFRINPFEEGLTDLNNK